MLDPQWHEKVLDFWFEELEQKDWFNGGDDIDARITSRFLSTYDALTDQTPREVHSDGGHALAAVIVLDQFSRNMFRKTAKAFSADPLAVQITRNAIDTGLDKTMSADEKHFLYMPLMHSENLDDQNQSVLLFETLGSENSLKFAREHRDVIARFGRFPHRNEVFGRTSTGEELAYLKDANRYGQ